MTLNGFVIIVRYFNLLINVGALVYLVLNFRKRRMYVLMNIAFAVSLLYGILIYSVIFIGAFSLPPFFSALGSTLNTLAIIAAITSQIEDKHDI